MDADSDNGSAAGGEDEVEIIEVGSDEESCGGKGVEEEEEEEKEEEEDAESDVPADSDANEGSAVGEEVGRAKPTRA